MTRALITETFRLVTIAICLSAVFVALYAIHIGVVE